MELNLSLSLMSPSSSAASSCNSSQIDVNCNPNYADQSMVSVHNSKRTHGDYDDDENDENGDDGYANYPTLPLLVWDNFCCDNNQSNDQEQGDDEAESNSMFVHQRNNEVGGVIGWPPVKLLCRSNTVDYGESKSTYVKVYMEGVGIARKVDLNQHQSYQTLANTLANMFGKCYEDVILTYQDKEGDWLLAGDVPWGSFVKTVQRLRLLKK